MHTYPRYFALLLVVLAIIAGCRDRSAADDPEDASTSPADAADGADGQAPAGTFLDRERVTDLRVVSYNVHFDAIFPDVDEAQAAKFVRVVAALDPDILNLQEIQRSAGEVAALMNQVAPLPDSAGWWVHKGRDNVIISKFPLSLTRTATSPPGERGLAMALVDLPDSLFARDLYIMNTHYRCCSSTGAEEARQQQSDALVQWMSDARAPGGIIELPEGTAMAVLGDLNIVEPPGALDPLGTVVTGDIFDEATYGPDAPPDWDGTALADSRPRHNATGAADYTWRDDNSSFDPGRLDYILYTDSALSVGNQFVLNTVEMTEADRAAAGLQPFDVTLDGVGATFDHLPLVVDFRPR